MRRFVDDLQSIWNSEQQWQAGAKKNITYVDLPNKCLFPMYLPDMILSSFETSRCYLEQTRFKQNWYQCVHYNECPEETPQHLQVGNFKQLCKQLGGEGLPKTAVYKAIKGRCTSDSTGNMLSHIYMVELLSSAAGLEFKNECGTGVLSSVSDKIPMQRLLPGNVTHNRSNVTSWKNVCSSCTSNFPHTCSSGLNEMVFAIRDDMQSIARSWVHLQERWDTGDDAVIYLRCGDVLKYKHHTEYGFVPYKVYKDILGGDTMTSIGIVVGSLDKNNCRTKDCDFAENCRSIVADLVEYLSKIFPLATVVIHNGPNEMVVSSYARMILAKKLVANPSTFSVYPAVASFGRSYIVKSDRLYPWINHIPEHLSNVQIVDEPFLHMGMIAGNNMKVPDIIAWLRNE